MTDERAKLVSQFDPDQVECKCGMTGELGATCPFSEDVYGEIRVCECCRNCQHECAMDI